MAFGRFAFNELPFNERHGALMGSSMTGVCSAFFIGESVHIASDIEGRAFMGPPVSPLEPKMTYRLQASMTGEASMTARCRILIQGSGVAIDVPRDPETGDGIVVNTDQV